MNTGDTAMSFTNKLPAILSMMLLLTVNLPAYAASPTVSPGSSPSVSVAKPQASRKASGPAGPGAQFTIRVPVDVSNVPAGWTMNIFCYLYSAQGSGSNYHARQDKSLPLNNGAYKGTITFNMNVDPQKGLPQEVTRYYCGITESSPNSGGSQIGSCGASPAGSFPKDPGSACDYTVQGNF
jgi:hypothetical protein